MLRVAEVAPGMATPTLVLKPLNHCTVWVVPAMVMAAGTIVREAGVPATTLVATGWVVMAALWYRVTVHTELVVLSVLPAPTVFVTTTRYFWALPVGKAGAWKLDELVPVLLKVAPPSVETCPWTLRVPPLGGPLPLEAEGATRGGRGAHGDGAVGRAHRTFLVLRGGQVRADHRRRDHVHDDGAGGGGGDGAVVRVDGRDRVGACVGLAHRTRQGVGGIGGAKDGDAALLPLVGDGAVQGRGVGQRGGEDGGRLAA